MIRRMVVQVEGKSRFDIELGLAEAVKRIRQGYANGQDSNATGAFFFEEIEAQRKRLPW